MSATIHSNTMRQSLFKSHSDTDRLRFFKLTALVVLPQIPLFAVVDPFLLDIPWNASRANEACRHFCWYVIHCASAIAAAKFAGYLDDFKPRTQPASAKRILVNGLAGGLAGVYGSALGCSLVYIKSQISEPLSSTLDYYIFTSPFSIFWLGGYDNLANKVGRATCWLTFWTAFLITQGNFVESVFGPIVEPIERQLESEENDAKKEQVQEETQFRATP